MRNKYSSLALQHTKEAMQQVDGPAGVLLTQIDRRKRCEEAAKELEPKWAKLRQLLSVKQAREDKIKKYCRRVRPTLPALGSGCWQAEARSAEGWPLHALNRSSLPDSAAACTHRVPCSPAHQSRAS